MGEPKTNSDRDDSIFFTFMVLLHLVCDSRLHQVILWRNLRTSFPRYCRPINFEFIHETTELPLQEEKYFDGQIRVHEPTVINFDTISVHVRHSSF